MRVAEAAMPTVGEKCRGEEEEGGSRRASRGR